MPSFADRAILATRRLGHPLCVGLDPHLGLLPELFRQGSMSPQDPQTSDAVEVFLGQVIDRVAGRVAVVKPQIAFFERLGWRGLATLERLTEKARAAGLLVLLDAKRGDIGSTAAAYAAAYFGGGADGNEAGLEVDALTINPYLGLDSLEPFFAGAKAAEAGLFVLVKTSNAGSGDFQDLEVGAAGKTLFEAVAETLAPTAEAWRGATGWSSLGVVVGATKAGDAPAVRARLPHSLFLVPGYGAQGGGAAEALAGFVEGPGGRREGGLVSSSRAVVFPAAAAKASSAAAWDQAFEDALARAIEDLAALM